MGWRCRNVFVLDWKRWLRRLRWLQVHLRYSGNAATRGCGLPVGSFGQGHFREVEGGLGGGFAGLAEELDVFLMGSEDRILPRAKLDGVENNGSEEGCAGDGEYPGPDDAASDTPADSGKAARSSDADNGARDRVRGADGNAKSGCADEGEPTGGFGRETAEGIELGDALAHGLDDAPAARHSSSSNRQVAANDYPVGDDEGLEQSSGHERGGDDAHAFLCVVGAVAEAVAGGGDELQATEPLINSQRALPANDPTRDDGNGHAQEHANQRREKNKSDGLNPAAKDERAKAGFCDRCAAEAADQGVRRTGREAENERDQVPNNRAEQTGEQDLLVHHFDVNHAFADGAGDSGAEEKCRNEIPKGSPRNGAKGREDARGNDRSDGIGGVMPAVREFEREREGNDEKEEREAGHRGSGALKDDAFDDVGDVLALVDGGLDDFENLFPLDDLDGVLFFVEELGNERPAEAVTFVFVAVDFDAVLEGALGRFDGANGGDHFGSGCYENFGEVQRAQPDGIHAIKYEAAGGGVNEVDDVVEAAAKLVDVFAIKGGNEGLVQLGEDSVSDFVAFVLEGFDDLHLLGHAGVVREHFEKGVGASIDIDGLFGEEVEETLFARQEPLQKSWHGV